jgi:Lrp/AsnC family transcriptional regulator for asnA, asnC and gidA
MVDDGLIRIAAIGNLNAMGFDFVAMVLIKVKPGTVDAVASALAGYASVRFVAVLFGGADIVIQTLHNTLDELHGFVRNRLPVDLPDIVSVETFPEVRTIKSSWDWNTWFSLQQGRPK